MVAPVDLIGTTASAITFIQVSYDFLRLVYDIYSEKPIEYEAASQVSQKLKDHCEGLIKVYNQEPTPGDNWSDKKKLSRNELAIHDLAQRCNTLAIELLKFTRNESPSKHKFADAVRTAFKLKFNKEKIIRLQHDLENCRTELQIHCQAESR
jgi:hypothetical protein